VEVEDDGKISQQAFSFVGIHSILELVQQKTIDLIGVVVDIAEREAVSLKSGLQKERKALTLADESGNSIAIVKQDINFLPLDPLGRHGSKCEP